MDMISRRCATALVSVVAVFAVVVAAANLSAAGATPYQAGAHAQCQATTNCILKFPTVPSGKRFDVQFAACEMGGSNGANVTDSRIYLQTQQNGQTISFMLARNRGGGQYLSKPPFSAVSQSVGFSVPAGQPLKIVAWPSSGSFADVFDCTVSGEMNDASAPGQVQFAASAKCPKGKNCVVSFPAVPAGKRFETRFVACESIGAGADARYYLQTFQNGKSIATDLSSVWAGYYYDGTNRFFAVSQPVMFSVPAQQVLKIFAWPDHNYGTAVDQMDCTVSGDLVDASTPTPYQATAQAKCPTGVNCVVAFPPASAPLHVQFVSCETRNTGSNLTDTRFYLQTQQGGRNVAIDLASTYADEQYDGTNFYWAEAQPIAFDVAANKVLKLFAWPSGGANPVYIDQLNCTVYGQLTQ